jgi:hypothetical protein
MKYSLVPSVAKVYRVTESRLVNYIESNNILFEIQLNFSPRLEVVKIFLVTAFS